MFFAVFFWLILGSVLAAIFGALVVIWFWARRNDRRVLKAILSASIILLICGVTGIIGTIAFGIVRSSRPSIVFERAFGISPPATVTDLKSQFWFFGDSGAIHLHFRSPAKVIDGIVTNGFATISFDEFDWETRDASRRVSWWKLPERNRIARFYRRVSNGNGRHFASETEVLAYFPETEEVFYEYSGID